MSLQVIMWRQQHSLYRHFCRWKSCKHVAFWLLSMLRGSGQKVYRPSTAACFRGLQRQQCSNKSADTLWHSCELTRPMPLHYRAYMST